MPEHTNTLIRLVDKLISNVEAASNATGSTADEHTLGEDWETRRMSLMDTLALGRAATIANGQILGTMEQEKPGAASIEFDALQRQTVAESLGIQVPDTKVLEGNLQELLKSAADGIDVLTTSLPF